MAVLWRVNVQAETPCGSGRAGWQAGCLGRGASSTSQSRRSHHRRTAGGTSHSWSPIAAAAGGRSAHGTPPRCHSTSRPQGACTHLVRRLLKLGVVGLHVGLVFVPRVVLLAHHRLQQGKQRQRRVGGRTGRRRGSTVRWQAASCGAGESWAAPPSFPPGHTTAHAGITQTVGKQRGRAGAVGRGRAGGRRTESWVR